MKKPMGSLVFDIAVAREEGERCEQEASAIEDRAHGGGGIGPDAEEKVHNKR